jgi:hypothetical protein
MTHIMDTVVKIVNCVCAGVLNRREFVALLGEIEFGETVYDTKSEVVMLSISFKTSFLGDKIIHGKEEGRIGELDEGCWMEMCCSVFLREVGMFQAT